MACRERTGRLFSLLEIFKAAGLTKLHGNHFSMWSKFILILLLITWTSNGSCLSLKQQQRKQSRMPLPLYDATSYDYDYGLDRAAWPVQKDANSDTTQRPLVRYFNNLMRNMRINMPTISWNVSNPLANLFNAGAPNVMETPVTVQHVPHYDYVPTSSTHIHKSSGKRRNSAKRDKHRKVAQTQVRHEEPATAAPKYRQYMLPAFPSGVDPMKTMYFYDPNTNKYFELQGMRSRGHYVQDNYYYNKDNYYDEENEGHESEGMDFEDSAAHEQDPKDNADSTESDSNEAYEEPDTPVNSESAEDDSADVSNDEETRTIKQFQSTTKREESLRNALGSYMSDDRLSRQRQKSKPKYAAARRNAERFEGRNKYKYYFLEPY